jgi:hypothetical protein
MLHKPWRENVVCPFFRGQMSDTSRRTELSTPEN